MLCDTDAKQRNAHVYMIWYDDITQLNNDNKCLFRQLGQMISLSLIFHV